MLGRRSGSPGESAVRSARLSPRETASPLSPHRAFLPHIKHQMDSQLSENTVTLSACLLNGSIVCGRYRFKVLYFHVRSARKAAGARGRGDVLQKCPETSNVTLSAER